MDNNHKKVSDKKLILKIPSTILSNQDLSFNEKLILALDYTFYLKKGYNKLSNIEVGALLSIHKNIICYSRKNLIKKQFLIKDKSTYKLTEKYLQYKEDQDQRVVYLPFEIYNHSKLKAGAKLLWGEYNSMSKGYKEYFAKRSYTSNRLGASEESISNWTRKLREHQLLKKYEIRKRYGKSQKAIITCQF